MHGELDLSALAACVHCGFCLQSCPTFLVTADEADSPRGRIVLMQALRTEPDPIMRARAAFHIDRCIGCRACEPACPSGVRYGEALELVRAGLTLERPLPLLTRVVLFVLGNDRLRKPVLRLARILRLAARASRKIPAIGFSAAMLAATRSRLPRPGRQPLRLGTPDSRRFTLFRGCIMDGLFPHVHEATVRTLNVQGLTPIHAPGQTCCGALHAHAGKLDEARNLAARNIRAFESVPGLIAVNSAGCGAMLREYPKLFRGTPLADAAGRIKDRVRDVTELLDPSRIALGRLSMRVAYDPPCHLLYAQGIAEEPLACLRAIAGLEIVPHTEAGLCCGSGGTYSLSQPHLAREILDRKVTSLLESGVEAVVSGNPGCIMQLGAGLAFRNAGIEAVHPVELVDLAYHRSGIYGASRRIGKV